MTERTRSSLDAYVEVGAKRSFAGAIEWPAWTRSARDEVSALGALVAYGPRYAKVLRGTRLGFHPPNDVSDLAVIERLKGTATTDFGAPDVAPAGDADPIDETELRRFGAILRACWRAFDRAVLDARGVTLAKGPRGGGRELDAIVEHVLGAEGSYIRLLGRKHSIAETADPEEELARIRVAVIEALTKAAREGVPPGPRGGKRWLPRYFVRRSAWHVLDHAWEIEDRAS